MDEQREPERIEIELTSHEPSRGPRRSDRAGGGDGDGPVVTTVGEPSVGVLETERGRLIAATALIGVVALLVGVLLGRAGSEGDVATADGAATSTTVRERASTTVSDDSEVLPPVRPVVTPPTTTRPAVTATPIGEPDPTEETEPIAPVKGVIAIDPELSDLGVEVIGLTLGGQVVRVDPATGNTVTYDVAQSSGPSLIFAGPDWVFVPTVPFGARPGAVVLADDGTSTLIETGGSWPFVMSDDGSGRFWIIDEPAATSNGLRLYELSLDGEPTGSELTLSNYPLFVDPLGGFVVDAPGGSYRVTPEGAERLSSGRVLAAGRTRLLVEECDEFLDCGYAVVDREDGERTTVDPAEEIGDRQTLDAIGYWVTDNAFNVEEDRLLVTFWDGLGDRRQHSGVLDLETGAFADFADLRGDGNLTVRWAPDGRSLLWLNSIGVLSVLDIETGESQRLSEDLGQLGAFALRPLPVPNEG